MPNDTNAVPDPHLAASLSDEPEAPEPEILDPSAAEWTPKGNARQPGARVEKPGMANLNAKGTLLLGRVAKARGMKTFTPQAVLVARGAADTYYLIPVETGTDKASEVKYSASTNECHVDLYPYLQQSELLVPTDHHWFVPAKGDTTSKYAPSLRLDFAARENLPITKRGPRKPPQV